MGVGVVRGEGGATPLSLCSSPATARRFTSLYNSRVILQVFSVLTASVSTIANFPCRFALVSRVNRFTGCDHPVPEKQVDSIPEPPRTICRVPSCGVLAPLPLCGCRCNQGRQRMRLWGRRRGGGGGGYGR